MQENEIKPNACVATHRGNWRSLRGGRGSSHLHTWFCRTNIIHSHSTFLLECSKSFARRFGHNGDNSPIVCAALKHFLSHGHGGVRGVSQTANWVCKIVSHFTPFPWTEASTSVVKVEPESAAAANSQRTLGKTHVFYWLGITVSWCERDCLLFFNFKIHEKLSSWLFTLVFLSSRSLVVVVVVVLLCNGNKLGVCVFVFGVDVCRNVTPLFWIIANVFSIFGSFL